MPETTVLIVDDDPVVRALLRFALEPSGARLVMARDGSEAIEVAAAEHPDIVLLDVGLPRLNGLDVCRALKTHPAPPHVVLMTGDAYGIDAADCGADAVIGKPFAPAEVLDHVLTALHINTPA